MKMFAIIIAYLFAAVTQVGAQSASINSGTAQPSSCSTGDVYITTTTPTLYVCNSPNTWTSLGAIGGGGGVPTNGIIFVDSGTCPSGFTEESGLDGYMWRGTVAAHGDVGGTSGSDTITPTVASLTAAAQTFSGSSATTSAVGAGTPAGTNTLGAFSEGAISWPVGVPTHSGTTINAVATVSGSKAGSSAGAFSTIGGVSPGSSFTPTINSQGTIAWPAGVPTIAAGSFTQPTFTGSALGTHTHTLTATGTNGTSAVTGTLNSFDNRPAYIKLIGCKKS